VFRIVLLSVALVLATAVPAAAVVYDCEIVGLTPDSVAFMTQRGELKVMRLSEDAKRGKPPSRHWNLPHSRLVVGQKVTVYAWRNNGVDEALGFRLLP
jgi:hypothetical protein